MGATVLTDGDIIPYFTTHVVTQMVSGALKQEINSIFNKQLGDNKSSKYMTESVKIVSMDWLSCCLDQGKLLPEADFLPQDDPSIALRKGKLKPIQAQMALFKSCKFYIITKSFDNQEDIEVLRMDIEVNGGKIYTEADMSLAEFQRQIKTSEKQAITQTQGKSTPLTNYIMVMEDAYQGYDALKESCSKIVHYRWVQESVREKKLQDFEESYHLMPL
jgi:hypothetical protein